LHRNLQRGAVFHLHRGAVGRNLRRNQSRRLRSGCAHRRSACRMQRKGFTDDFAGGCKARRVVRRSRNGCPGAVAIFQGMGIEALGEGFKDHWFGKLTPERKDAALHCILSAIAANTNLLKLSINGGNNDDWFKLITALAVSGAPQAEDYFVEFASKVENADSEETLRAEFRRCQKAADGRITVGTLLKYACDAGADLSPWRRQAEAKPALLLPMPFINISNWDNEPLPEREWAVPNRIPLRQVGLFSGEGGAGKSYVTLHLCVAHALGRDWLHSKPTP